METGFTANAHAEGNATLGVRRLLVISFTYLPDLDGVAMATASMAEGMQREGWSVRVFTTCQQEQRCEWQIKGIPVIGFSITGEPSIWRKPQGELQRFKDEIQFFSPDLIVIHSWASWPVTLLREFWNEISAPKIIVGHGFGIHKIPWRWRPPFGLRQWIGYLPFVFAMPKLYRNLDALVTLGRTPDFLSGFDRWLSQYAHPKKVAWIPNGVARIQADANAFRAKYCISDKLIYLCVANYSNTKNQLLLVESFACAAISNAILILIGSSDNDYCNKVRSSAIELGVSERVMILVNIPRQDVEEAIMTADVAMLTSRSEMQPIFLLEAMAIGRPWICTNVGCVIELEGGLIVPSRRDHIAKAMERMAIDPNFRRLLGKQGNAQWNRDFTPDEHVRRWKQLCVDVLT